MDEEDQVIPAIARLEGFSNSVAMFVKQYEKAPDNVSKAAVWHLLKRAIALETEAKREVINNYRRTYFIASCRKAGELIDTDYINAYFLK